MFNFIDISSTIVFSQELFITIIINLVSAIGIFIFFFFIFNNVLKKIYSFKNFNFKKKLIGQIFCGACFALSSPLLIYISNIINSQYFNFSQIFILSTYSLLTSTFSIIGIIPIFIISNYFLNNTPDSVYLIFIILFYSLTILFVFFNRFFLSQSKRNFILTSLVLTFLLIILISIFYNSSPQLFLNNFTNLIINGIFSLLFYAIALRILNLIDNTYKLRASIIYSDDKFVNPNYANQAFLNYVEKNNVETGIIIVLSINGIEQLITSEGNEFGQNIEKKFINYLIYRFGKSLFYFKTNNNKYAFFIPIKKELINLNQSIKNNFKEIRDKNDFLFSYSKILKNSLVGVDVNNKKYRLVVKGYCAIYGVQSNIFTDLIDNINNFEKKVISDKNINILQMTYFQGEEEKNYDLNLINQKFNLNELVIKLNEVLVMNKKQKFKNFLFPNISLITENIYDYKKIYNLLNDDPNLINIFLRNIAWRSLVLFSQLNQINPNNNFNLILNYSFVEISKKSFSDIELIKKIHQNNIEPNRLIFNFNLSFFDVDSVETINNLNTLRKNNIKICFEGIDEKNLFLLKTFKPNFVIINNFLNKQNKEYFDEYTKKIVNFLLSEEIDVILKN